MRRRCIAVGAAFGKYRASMSTISKQRNRVEGEEYVHIPNCACTQEYPFVLINASHVGATSSPLPELVKAVVKGMRDAKIKRLMVQTGAFCKLKGEKTSLTEKLARSAFGYMMKEKATLKGNDEAMLFLQDECKDLDWTVMRPGMLSDGPSTGMIRHAFDYGPGIPNDHPSKVDLTRWYLELVNDSKSFKKGPTLEYAPPDEDFGFARVRVGGGKRVAVITGGNSGLGQNNF